MKLEKDYNNITEHLREEINLWKEVVMEEGKISWEKAYLSNTTREGGGEDHPLIASFYLFIVIIFFLTPSRVKTPR